MDTLKRASVTRKSLPLSERDVRDLTTMRGSDAHRAALSQLANVEVSEDASEAALLHAVMEAGIKAVEQQVEADGYARIALGMDSTARQSAARRRRPTWADE